MKHMKLLLLVVLGLMISPVYARNESGWLKKTAHVAFYLAETVAGCHFFNTFHAKSQSLWPWRVADTIGRDPYRAGSEALACVLLLSHGLRGLDKELHLREQFKK